MKVNSVNIQAYQQVGRREQAAPPPAKEDQKQSVQNVTIEPQNKLTGSKLAVKAPSKSYAEYLSADEKRSLETLFAKYRDTARFGTGYQTEADGENPAPTLGRVIDVKV
jgi:hypothetical protein